MHKNKAVALNGQKTSALTSARDLLPRSSKQSPKSTQLVTLQS
jgi:hypothetical protein